MPLARPVKLAIVLVGLAFAATFAHALYSVFGLGKPGLSDVYDKWVYHGVLVAASLACLLRGLLIRRDHAAWLVITAGVCAWTLGDVYWTFKLSTLDEIPYPSIADAFYVAGYPALYVGIAMLARTRAGGTRFDAGLWLDGLLGGLAVAAIGAAFLYPALQGATDGNVTTVAVNLAYPLGDVLLLSFVVGAVTLTGWRLDRGWALLGGGLAVTAIADCVYLQQEATVGFTAGSWPDTLWLLGTTAIAGAALTLKAAPKEASVRALRGRLVLPALFALCGGVGILMYDHFERVSTLSIWLAGATLLVVLVRMTLAFEENLGLLRRTQVEALVDALTGLGNRRRLLRDLEPTEDGPQPRRMLVLFDLDGFKAYNDAFGHPAGDALLARLGHKLQAAAKPYGRAYRLGGDEFCVLAGLDRVAPESLLVETTSALWETGEGFSIGSSRGAAVLPDETSDPAEAIRIADQRMYAQKNTRPRSPRRQTIDVLLRTLQEREPGLGSHVQGVVHLALAMGRRLGLDAEELDVVARGAELHDVGKMAVPDAILRKPGPLNEQEWKVMRTHTLIGERILGAAPALAPVATLVRSSHERWNGSGYPDGLVGEEIPLGARIIAVCEAFEAMVGDRPWRAPMSKPEALAELRRCAGTQFDPGLVELFAGEVYPELFEAGERPDADTARDAAVA